MTKIEQIEHFQTRIHTFCLLMPVGDFHHHTLYNVWFKSPKKWALFQIFSCLVLLTLNRMASGAAEGVNNVTSIELFFARKTETIDPGSCLACRCHGFRNCSVDQSVGNWDRWIGCSPNGLRFVYVCRPGKNTHT